MMVVSGTCAGPSHSAPPRGWARTRSERSSAPARGPSSPAPGRPAEPHPPPAPPPAAAPSQSTHTLHEQFHMSSYCCPTRLSVQLLTYLKFTAEFLFWLPSVGITYLPDSTQHGCCLELHSNVRPQCGNFYAWLPILFYKAAFYKCQISAAVKHHKWFTNGFILIKVNIHMPAQGTGLTVW